MDRLDPARIRALVRAVVPAGERRRVVAVRAAPEWPHGPIDDAGRHVEVVPCASPLAVRAAVVDHPPGEDDVLVVLTPCADRDLGVDLLARLAKRRVIAPDPFTAILTIFHAKVLDPALTRDERWLVDELIQLAPPGGWAGLRPRSDVLDLGTAWAAWHLTRFGSATIPETLVEVIALGERTDVRDVLAAMEPEQRARLAARWAGGGPVVTSMVDELAADHGHDLAALGLVAGVLWAPTDDAELAVHQSTGKIRFESRFGRDRLHAAAAAQWHAAAEAAIATAEVPQGHVDRAEELLRDKGVSALAVLSDRMASGFDLRLDRLAAALRADDVPAAEAALAAVCAHDRAVAHPQRVHAAESAVRLLRREARRRTGGITAPTSSGLAAQVEAYRRDGAWVDDARRHLADGDSRADLIDTYERLLAEVDRQRREAEVRFAGALATWCASEPVPHPDLVPIEHVLDEIVAPIAKQAPVLLLVFDGLSLAASHELLEDLRTEHWSSVVPEGRDDWPVGVAMLPTVTEVSRTSLLTGTRMIGDQQTERTAFPQHPALRAAGPARRPVLFHKADLVGTSGRSLSAKVRGAVADEQQRVVGVVVNAVDDLLGKGQQARVRWGMSTITPLAALLEAAADAQRVVIITADHGHVLHVEGAELRSAGGSGGGGGGERWRTAPPEAGDGEIAVTGPRVLQADHVVLPVDERIRYGPSKHGYHGGATAQEALVPIEVLARTLPAGWRYRRFDVPDWWLSTAEAERRARADVDASTALVAAESGAVTGLAQDGTSAAVPDSVPAAPVPQVPAAPTDQPPTLFDPEPQPDAASGSASSPAAPSTSVEAPVVAGNWIAALLASPVFVAHRQRARLPRPLPDERLVGYLSALHANGGTMPIASLSARTGEPPDVLRFSLQAAQRLLNLDGADVLALRGDGTVQLDLELLTLQFEIRISPSA